MIEVILFMIIASMVLSHIYLMLWIRRLYKLNLAIGMRLLDLQEKVVHLPRREEFEETASPTTNHSTNPTKNPSIDQ